MGSSRGYDATTTKTTRRSIGEVDSAEACERRARVQMHEAHGGLAASVGRSTEQLILTVHDRPGPLTAVAVVRWQAL